MAKRVLPLRDGPHNTKMVARSGQQTAPATPALPGQELHAKALGIALQSGAALSFSQVSNDFKIAFATADPNCCVISALQPLVSTQLSSSYQIVKPFGLDLGNWFASANLFPQTTCQTCWLGHKNGPDHTLLCMHRDRGAGHRYCCL